MGTLLVLLGLAFFGAVVYLTVKQIEFIVKAIPLYEEMTSNQKQIISLLEKMVAKNG